jgi:threonine aldolase
MAHLRKTSMQLGSKMRFLSVQFEALLGGGLWLRSAARSNAMTQRLYEAVRELPGVEIARPVQANQIFAVLPPAVTERLQKRFRFYTWDEQTGEVRWMTSFDTTEDDVDAFAAAIAEELAAERGQGAAGALSVAEREELVRLRRKVREMEETIEALEKEPDLSASRESK